MADHDVAVIGASLAGCTVATLLARAGARVALVEQHRDPGAYKVLCTHHVMSCATSTIRRLGLAEAVEAAGGVRNGLDTYTPWGWVRTPAGTPHGYSIRREKLDPMVRRTAAETPGVELLLGQKVTGIVDVEGRVGGVRLRGTDGTERVVRARLVVGADGAHSTVAALAGAEERVAPNRRFVYFAQFTGVHLRTGTRTHLWMHEAGISYAMPNEDGVTVMACMPVKDDLPRFKAEREGSLLATLRALPDGPAMDGAERVSKIIGATDLPLVTRDAVPVPGIALVGDAAMTSDPSQGVGCGWALQSGEWLADEVAPALLDDAPLDAALRRYAQRRRFLEGHQSVIEKEALAGPPTRLDRVMVTGAVHDPKVAAHLVAFFNRTMSVGRFLAPGMVLRAARVALGNRSRVTRGRETASV